MDYKTLLLSSKDGVCLITINRPEALNALSETVSRELLHAIAAVEADPAIRVVILTGSGKAFVAGADISQMSTMTPEEARAFSILTGAIPLQMERSHKIYIGAINGYALGGGCELALGCDLRIAAESARFGLPEVTLGVLPGAGGTQRMPRLIGQQRAMELILTGRHVKAQEALELGIVCKVVPAEELLDAAYAMAEAIMKNAPWAVAYAKECVSQSQELPLGRGLNFETQLFGLCFATRDQKEGMSAFLEKRPAQFAAGLDPR